MWLVPVTWCLVAVGSLSEPRISRKFTWFRRPKRRSLSPTITTVPYLPHLSVHYGSFSVTNHWVTAQGLVTSQNIPFSKVPQTAFYSLGKNLVRILVDAPDCLDVFRSFLRVLQPYSGVVVQLDRNRFISNTSEFLKGKEVGYKIARVHAVKPCRRCWGRVFRAVHVRHRRQIDVSGKLHAAAILPPVPTE
jgi:hypothetical protein